MNTTTSTTQQALTPSYSDRYPEAPSWQLHDSSPLIGELYELIGFQHPLSLITLLRPDQSSVIIGQHDRWKADPATGVAPSRDKAYYPWATAFDEHSLDLKRPILLVLHYPMAKDVSSVLLPAMRTYLHHSGPTSPAIPAIPSYGYLAWQVAKVYQQIYQEGRSEVEWWGTPFDQLILESILIHRNNTITVAIRP